ncbi:CDP-glucose 4,6-dehydratase [Rhodobacteraceae bacterium (ex Bugula neritina AB1)]|nr:CDP-glucose 4,6-dehydratase [Rhodobacteraceae bacterium (ex Bugula neritina AB1)]
MTGHTGFKGSWLTAWLLQMQAQVCGFALPPSMAGVPEGRQSFFDELGLAAQIDHVPGDLRDQNALQKAVKAFDPEIVIHMAAQPLVRHSYAAPVETYATNVMGTVHLLEACRTVAPSLRSVVVVSSDKCYENREQIWGYRESDAMGGHDPYSASKGCTELVTASYRNSYFPPDRLQEHGVMLASGRAGNVIGGGDWSPDRIVPDAMRAFTAGQTLRLRHPGALRPWQHVLEPLAGYLRLAEMGVSAPGDCARGWNFGPADEMNLSVEEMISGFAATLGPGFQWTSQPDSALHEATLLKLDCSAACQLLGWQPQLDADLMMAWTAEWYNGQTPEQRATTVGRQITDYRSRLSFRSC